MTTSTHVAVALIAIACLSAGTYAGSCAQYGCSPNWVPGRDCQCNPACPSYSNCCSDYYQVCARPSPPPPPPNPAFPSSCAELAYKNPTYTDGTYRLQCGSQPVTDIYCADMKGDSPREFLNLGSDMTENIATYQCGQDCKENHPTASTIKTVYSKLRINPCTLMVDITETAFATSTGGITHGNTKMTFEPFGVAESCEPSGEGDSNIDLSQTPFEIRNQWKIGGATPHGKFSLSPTLQMANITGGGFCGHNGPVGWNPFAPRADPQWVLQLAYRPGKQ